MVHEPTTEVEKSIDLRGSVCPMTTYQARRHLESVAPGDVVCITLEKGDQVGEVSQNIKEEGHQVIDAEHEEEAFHLLVRRGNKND